MRKLLGLLATGIAIALTIGGCSLPRRSITVVKVGLIAPFEGLGRPIGYEALHAVKLAILERNESGELGRYGVVLVALNDNDQASHAQRQALKMDVDDDVIGVIGPLSRSTIEAVADPLEAAGLAWVVPGPASDPTVLDHNNCFRLFASDEDLAREAVEQVLSEWLELPVKITVDTEGSFSAALREAAQAHDAYQPGVIDDWFQVSPLALGGTAEEVAALLLERGGGEGVIAGPEVGRDVLYQRAGDAANGLLWVSSAAIPDSSELFSRFAAGYQELAGVSPGPKAILAYDATIVLLDAVAADIARNGYPSREGVLEAMQEAHGSSISGDIRFDADGNWINAPVYVYRVAGQDLTGRP